MQAEQLILERIQRNLKSYGNLLTLELHSDSDVEVRSKTWRKMKLFHFIITREVILS